MEKLMKLIVQLPETAYGRLETDLITNRSEKTLLLLQSMRSKKVPDDLLAKLRCNENALYVLKSRLYDKVQKHLVEDNEGKLHNGVHDISISPAQILFEYPREVAIAMLHELEKKYLQNDIPGELIDVYSALKKVHYNSDKYYYYSQLYNKQVAYTAALEKAEDVLFSFNQTLCQYHFSRQATALDLIRVLKNEIDNIYALNQSHRIQLIRNFIGIEIQLYTPLQLKDEAAAEDLLDNCEEIASAFPNDTQVKYYRRAIHFLRFEYYVKINQPKKAQMYFDEVDSYGKDWLLLWPVCQVHRFLLSKITFLQKHGSPQAWETSSRIQYLENKDPHSKVCFSIYKSLVHFYSGRIKEASTTLQELINEISFKDQFYMECQVKLTLAFYYTYLTQYDLAEQLTKSIYRKLTDEKKELFANAKAFIKLLMLRIDDDGSNASKAKMLRAAEQFTLYNNGDYRLLEFLTPDLQRWTVSEQYKRA